MMDYITITGVRKRSFVIPTKATSGSNSYNLDFPTVILWDDGTVIQWDDNTNIEWSNNRDSYLTEIGVRKRSFSIPAKVNR